MMTIYVVIYLVIAVHFVCYENDLVALPDNKDILYSKETLSYPVRKVASLCRACNHHNVVMPGLYTTVTNASVTV